MSRYILHLIEDARDSSENTEFTTTTGIQDREFIRYLNEGQIRLHNLVTQQHPRVFEKEVVYSLSKSQESVELPQDIHVKNMITMVEYSYTGKDEDYRTLKLTSQLNRSSGVEGHPCHYFVRSNKVFLIPTSISNTATLRVTYIRRAQQLGKRMAQVSSAILDNNAKTITTLEVDVSSFGVDTDSLDRADSYFTVVDSTGKIKMDSVRFDDLSTATGTVTVNSSFTFKEGETIDAGDYLISGKSSSSHIDTDLTDMAERYIEGFCIYKILKRDSSVDSQEQLQELSGLEEEIVASYAEIPHDVTEIPQISDEGTWF